MKPDSELCVLYRGLLASCNYGCAYCPFGKRVDTRADLERDAEALARFVGWVMARDRPTRVLFTPWGEALIRRPYQRALLALARAPHVRRAAIQTNLSAPLDWLEGVDRAHAERLGIWATYHPGWIELDAFVAKVRALHERGVRVSAGVVGTREHFDAIAALRGALPADIYLWVNAYKCAPDYYRADEIAWLSDIDPLFPVNNQHHASLGRACRAGYDAISVDGEGVARRCHFVREPALGNIHDRDFQLLPGPAPCPNQTCGCHIGYVHLEHLRDVRAVFGPGLLERVPIPGALSRR